MNISQLFKSISKLLKKQRNIRHRCRLFSLQSQSRTKIKNNGEFERLKYKFSTYFRVFDV